MDDLMPIAPLRVALHLPLHCPCPRIFGYACVYPLVPDEDQALVFVSWIGPWLALSDQDQFTCRTKLRRVFPRIASVVAPFCRIKTSSPTTTLCTERAKEAAGMGAATGTSPSTITTAWGEVASDARSGTTRRRRRGEGGGGASEVDARGGSLTDSFVVVEKGGRHRSLSYEQ